MKYLDFLKLTCNCQIVKTDEDNAHFVTSSIIDKFKPYIKLGDQLKCPEFALLHELGHKWFFEHNPKEHYANRVKLEVIASLYAMHKLLKSKQKRFLKEGLKEMEKCWFNSSYSYDLALQLLKTRRIWKRCENFVKSS